MVAFRCDECARLRAENERLRECCASLDRQLLMMAQAGHAWAMGCERSERIAQEWRWRGWLALAGLALALAQLLFRMGG